MKIDINKDFEKAFPDDLWKGFTLKQIITFSVGLVIPPRTTGVGRGFPTFRAGSSIIYRSSMNLVPLSAERRTTSMSTIDRCGGIAATDRNFCLFRDTRSLTDSGSY